MSKLEKIEEYWNKRSEGFSKGILDELRDDYDKWQEKLEKLTEDSVGKRVLDIGCGPGFFTILLGEMGFEVTAFDYSADMLKEAEENARKAGIEAKYIKGDAQKLPFEEESFDIIISRNLTWNLEKPEKAYHEWLRVLTKGGILINCDGNHYTHYYSEEYRLERESRGFNDGHNPEYMKNIDVSVIDNIARDLPLSREIRPKWDIERLLDMGVEKIGAEIERHKFADNSGKEHSIIKNFVLKAVK